jgi:hypothetical protein
MLKRLALVLAPYVLLTPVADRLHAAGSAEPPLLLTQSCDGSPAEPSYCQARSLFSERPCGGASTEERLACLEEKVARQAEELAALQQWMREFFSPGVKKLGMADR